MGLLITLGLVLLVAGLILLAIGGLAHNSGVFEAGKWAAIIGLVLVLIGWLVSVLGTEADAAMLALPFGPHAARLLRWAADRLDPEPRTYSDTAWARAYAAYNGVRANDGEGWHTVSPSWPKPGDPTRN